MGVRSYQLVYIAITNDMSSGIPVSTNLTESAVIKASLTDVWHLIKLPSFAQWWSALEKSEAVKGSSDEADLYKFTYKDGTVQEVKQEEHSSIEHYITFSVISSTPALSYTSSLSTIRLFAITSGSEEGSTFVQYSGSFSGDADAGVLGDAKYKRIEALKDLAAAASKKN